MKIYRHKRSGREYGLMCVANEHAADPDFVVTAVYVDGEGRVWSRPLAEFQERFEEKVR